YHCAGASDSAKPRWVEGSRASGGMLPVSGTDWRGQNRSCAKAGGIFVRQREVAGSLRYVGIHGEAFRIEIDRSASRIRGIRGRRTTDRTRAPDSLFRNFAG